MAYFKKIETDELYLYMNGKLIYKRWLKTGQSQVFDVMAYDKYTLTSFRGEVQYFNSFKELFLVKAKLKLIPTEDGGRKNGISTGYRPNHVFEYNEWNQILQTFIGDVILDEQTSIEPGEEKEVTIRFLLNQSGSSSCCLSALPHPVFERNRQPHINRSLYPVLHFCDSSSFPEPVNRSSGRTELRSCRLYVGRSLYSCINHTYCRQIRQCLRTHEQEQSHREFWHLSKILRFGLQDEPVREWKRP